MGEGIQGVYRGRVEVTRGDGELVTVQNLLMGQRYAADSKGERGVRRFWNELEDEERRPFSFEAQPERHASVAKEENRNPTDPHHGLPNLKLHGRSTGGPSIKQYRIETSTPSSKTRKAAGWLATLPSTIWWWCNV
ncbi:hypothetical protein EYC84_004273 [Monilinia fructicola]|uniref:Uncharacterized protein n=1 Tax=Monilinia fructicola TaxID=38448 RepID=A0A5M9JZS9_MONFR|nr:hypothetical protein EYC84_004273 [Monilinia fructicola]